MMWQKLIRLGCGITHTIETWILDIFTKLETFS